MKGYTIKESIDLLEKEVKKAGGGGSTTPTAADVTYDNTSSGLTADDVQEAIDELDAVIKDGHVYSTDEHYVGKWIDGSDLYEITLQNHETSIVGNTSIDVTSKISALNIDKIISYDNRAVYSAASATPPLSGQYVSSDLIRLLLNSSNEWKLGLSIGGATLTEIDIDWTIRYTKTLSNTKKKKGGK